PKGAKGKTHLGLLGKGVTFDTGGVSIKPAAKMWEMKGDMSGAAAVLYGMEAIAAIKPKVRVTGIIVTAQNYVDANAIVPGDIIRGRNGKCIHVDNTDAEGRLILTDGLWRAGEEKVTHLVDFATLTGAIVRALGTSLSGAFGNDDFVDRVMSAAESCGELCWKMPLHQEYIELMKCDVADINNIGSKPEGGAIQAALFLKEFLPDGISWAHMDIAGTFIVSGKWKYYRPGATGVMVKTIPALAQEMAS
ncbi:leucyl aminopeptidase family protein, partial [Candidatus Sumerlaeota bacterium]|nr:leucyl aminopeptidase family protein [Candidatus Sumerlaeota bacterium]